MKLNLDKGKARRHRLKMTLTEAALIFILLGLLCQALDLPPFNPFNIGITGFISVVNYLHLYKPLEELSSDDFNTYD